jgi:hypothetical protein
VKARLSAISWMMLILLPSSIRVVGRVPIPLLISYAPGPTPKRKESINLHILQGCPKARVRLCTIMRTRAYDLMCTPENNKRLLIRVPTLGCYVPAHTNADLHVHTNADSHVRRQRTPGESRVNGPACEPGGAGRSETGSIRPP